MQAIAQARAHDRSAEDRRDGSVAVIVPWRGVVENADGIDVDWTTAVPSQRNDFIAVLRFTSIPVVHLISLSYFYELIAMFYREHFGNFYQRLVLRPLFVRS